MVTYALLVTHSKGYKVYKVGFVKDWTNFFSCLFVSWEEKEERRYKIKMNFESIILTRDIHEARTCQFGKEKMFSDYNKDQLTIQSAIISKSKLLEGKNPTWSWLVRDEHNDKGDWNMEFIEVDEGTQVWFNERFPLPRKPIPKKTKIIVYEKFGGRCAYCGKKIKFSELQVDHIESHISGGKDEISNYLPSCQLCNRVKSGGTLEEFRKYIESDAPRIHFKKNRKWYADADRIVDYYHLRKNGNKVVFYFEKGEQK